MVRAREGGARLHEARRVVAIKEMKSETVSLGALLLAAAAADVPRALGLCATAVCAARAA